MFPNLHLPFLGDGMTIALVAVTHVFISHGLAIGMLSVIVFLEHLGLVRNDPEMTGLAKNLLKPVVIIVTAVGAVTGAGIWFTVSVVAPGGIGSLLRVFFWPWFIEWIAFTLEVVILLPYYFLWERLEERHPGLHAALGWSYVVTAFASAFLISGILAFMLTPNGWLSEYKLALAFFNPGFWPQLILRFFGGLTLGGLLSLAMVLFSRSASPFMRRRVGHILGVWVLAGAVATGAAAWAYLRTVPETYATHSTFAVLTSHLSQKSWLLWGVNVLAALCIAAAGAAAWRNRTLAARLLIIPAIILALGLVTEFERVREFIRGPYLVPGYMYANQVLLTEGAAMNKEGMLGRLAWYQAQPPGLPLNRAGHALFMANCGVCHTIGGLNDIRDRVRGRTFSGIAVMMDRTARMVPFMPPFSGNRAERLTTAAYLYQLAGDKRALSASPPLGKEAGHE